MAEQFNMCRRELTSSNVLSLIGDMRNDFDTLYTEISTIKKCIDDDAQKTIDQTHWEQLLSHLSIQNDSLEEALQRTTREKAQIMLHLQQNNESLKCQIENLKHDIQLLHASTASGDGRCSNQNCQEYIEKQREKMSKEVEDLKNQVNKLCLTENLYLELEQKHKKLNEVSEKQRDLLLQSQSQFTALQKSNEKIVQEKKILERDHIIQNEKLLQLSKNLAVLEGKNESLQEKVNDYLKEITRKEDSYKAKMEELQNFEHKYTTDIAVEKAKSRELEKKLVDLYGYHKELTNKYDEELKKSAIQQKKLDYYKQWQEEQLEADRTTSERLDKYEEHINLLLIEKCNFLDKFKKMERDNEVMQQHIMRFLGGTNTSAYLFPTIPNQVPEDSIFHESAEKMREIKHSLQTLNSLIYNRIINPQLNPEKTNSSTPLFDN